MRASLLPRARTRALKQGQASASHLSNHQAQSGARAGMPIFLQRATARPLLKMDSRSAAFEQEADRVSASVDAQDYSPLASAVHPASTGTLEEPSLAVQILRHRLDRSMDTGAPIPAAAREPMEQKFARDFSGVRVHANAKAAQLSQSLGANAFTTGNDIYFGDNKYDPDSRGGRSLLAHELTHVAQRGGGTAAPIQCDLTMSMAPTALGGFEMGFVLVQAPATPGMSGTIEFHPDPTGPYSTEIVLIQTANLQDVGGVSTGIPGTPFHWTGGEAPRNDVRTPVGGSFIDALYASNPQSSATGPEYDQPSDIAANPIVNHHGWLRSPTDVREASLFDNPNASFDSDFTFETVAKGSDNQVVYGAVNWGFQIRGGVAQNDYANAVDTESAEFDEALERFRGYYTHEPIVLYFDTDKDMPMAGELAKLSDVTSYMSRYPDVQVQVDGYADETGPANATRRADYNLDLSLRRADHAQAILAGIGVSESRMDLTVGRGQTTTFSAGSPAAAAGSLHANRRVVISFVRNASSLINP